MGLPVNGPTDPDCARSPGVVLKALNNFGKLLVRTKSIWKMTGCSPELRSMINRDGMLFAARLWQHTAAAIAA